MRVTSVAWIALILATAGCCSTRDVSTTAEYAPWIGKTVTLAGSGGYNVFAPPMMPLFISPANFIYGTYPIVAKLPDGYPVVIQAVKRTEGRYLIGDIPFRTDEFVLSMEDPAAKGKRMIIWSELNYVEPFKTKQGHVTGAPGAATIKPP